MQWTHGLSSMCAMTGIIPCDGVGGGGPQPFACILGDLENGVVVNVTPDHEPELVGTIPAGWTLTTFYLTDGISVYGPFVATVAGTDWTSDVLITLPSGTYTVVGQPAADALGNPRPVLCDFTIMDDTPLGILAGPDFGILANDTLGVLANA